MSKWYAEYLIDRFCLYSEKERNQVRQSCEDDSRPDETIGMREFSTFKEAKKWVREGIECDMDDLRGRLSDLKSMRARDKV